MVPKLAPVRVEIAPVALGNQIILLLNVSVVPQEPFNKPRLRAAVTLAAAGLIQILPVKAIAKFV